MPKTEEERMQNAIYRDTTIVGRVTNAAIDFGRGLVGKPSLWHEVRDWELRQEVEKARGQVVEPAATAPTVTQTPQEIADRLAAEMTKDVTPDRAGGFTREGEVFSRDVSDPFIGKDFRIEVAVTRDGTTLFQVQDLDSGERLYAGACEQDSITTRVNDLPGWLEEHVAELTQQAELAWENEKAERLVGLGR